VTGPTVLRSGGDDETGLRRKLMCRGRDAELTERAKAKEGVDGPGCPSDAPPMKDEGSLAWR